MANVGGQLGNKNSAKARTWENALRVALASYESKGVKQGQALRKIAELTVRQALEGDKDARKEIGDRLDGKPAQAIMGEGGGPVEIRHTLIQSVLDEKK